MTLDRRTRARNRAPLRRRAAALALVVAPVLLAVACGTDARDAGEDSSTSGAEAPANATDTSTSSTSVPAPVDDAWTNGVIEAPPQLRPIPPVPVVHAVRTGTHAGYDRFVIELEGLGIPGYHVEYVDKPLHQCGSGDQIFPVGQGWLEVRLEPAQAHTEEGRATLSGREIEASGRLLRRVYVTCDFEGMVTLVLALDSPNRFQVSTLREPGRIVVDVRH